MSSERTRYSPVVYWSSEWKNETLILGKINKESSIYKRAAAKKAAEETWKGKTNV